MRSADSGRTSLLPPAPSVRRWPVIGVLALALLGGSLAPGSASTPAAPAAAAKRGTANPVFGIIPQDGALPPDSDLDLIAGAGVGGLRTMLPWGVVERTPGEYDWSPADAVVRETIRRGIQPLMFLYGTPDWAARQDGYDCAPGGCGVYPPRSPATRQAFRQFAAAAAARYGPGGDFWEAPAPPEAPCPGEVPPCPPLPSPEAPAGAGPPCECAEPRPITTWQVWNEQNSPKYFAPKVNARRYVALLRSAAAGIRSVDPAAEIVLGGMWGPEDASDVVTPTDAYLERLYALGADDSFDSIAIHPYADTAADSLAQLESARRVVAEAHDRGTGLWVTEVGWASRGPTDHPYVKGLLGQARILARTLSAYERRARSLKLRGVFWYSWRDKAGGKTICEWCGNAGLRGRSGGPKPAWRAFVRVARD